MSCKSGIYVVNTTTGTSIGIGGTYVPPTEMMDKWEKDHKKYVEKSAWIKQMLSM